MRAITVHKALSGDVDIEALTIVVGPTMPRLETIELQQIVQERDASELAAALHEHLPGGTFDRLLGHLLKRKASDLLVSFAEWEVRR